MWLHAALSTHTADQDTDGSPGLPRAWKGWRPRPPRGRAKAALAGRRPGQGQTLPGEGPALPGRPRAAGRLRLRRPAGRSVQSACLFLIIHFQNQPFSAERRETHASSFLSGGRLFSSKRAEGPGWSRAPAPCKPGSVWPPDLLELQTPLTAASSRPLSGGLGIGEITCPLRCALAVATSTSRSYLGLNRQ